MSMKRTDLEALIGGIKLAIRRICEPEKIITNYVPTKKQERDGAIVIEIKVFEFMEDRPSDLNVNVSDPLGLEEHIGNA